MKVTDAQPRIFRGKTGFLEERHFDKNFMHDIEKKGSAGKIFMFFLQDILKIAFKMRI